MRKILSSFQKKAFILFSFIILLIFKNSYSQTATFTTSGTWTCPVGVTTVSVSCWGAGGAGGGSNLNNGVGGGGGGGGFAKNASVTVSAGTLYNITVGTGGVAVSAAAGGNGGSSSFGSTVIAIGGNGGALGNATSGIAGGTGGTGNTGVTIYNGGTGGTSAASKSGGGGGGAGTTGAGGNGNQNIAGTGATLGGGNGAAGRTANNNGLPGVTYGGGGSGAFGANGANANKPGGGGAQGKVEITWSCTSYNSLTAATTGTSACAGSTSTLTLTSSSLTTGTYTVSYTLSGANTGSSTASMSFTTGSPGTGTFTTGTLASSGATTITINSLASGGTTGTVSGATNCNSATTTNNTATITVNAVPSQPSAITGTSSVCASSTQVYSVTAVGGVTYTWNLPAAGWSIASGQGTNAVTYNVGGASGTVSVTPSISGCIGAARTLAVTVNGSTPGNYSIGPTGNFATIGAAITTLQNGCTIAGNYIFELNAAYVSTVETFPLSIPNISWMSATNTVTFRPETGATNLSITSGNSTGTLTLNNAKYYIFDGRAGGTGTNSNLSVINTSTTAFSIQLINNAQYNSLKYLTVKGVNTTLTEAVLQFSTSSSAGAGNSYNTIDYCDLGAGATAPANIIHSLGTSGRNNTSNIISNNKIHDFFYPSGAGCNGVLMQDYTDSWSITNNSFYETSSRVFSSINSPWSAIELANKIDGNSTLISGNFIGGTAPNCGGTPMTITGLGNIRAIKIKGGPGTANTVTGNTIANIDFTTSSVSVDAMIYHSDGSLNISDNIIGATTGTGSITYTGTAGLSKGSSISILFLGGAIVSGSPEATVGGTINVTNNTIGAITVTSTDSTQLRVIDFEQSLCTYTITGNTLGNNTANNIINNSKQTTLGMIGFAGKPGVTHTISNNIIQNFYVPNASTSNQVVGIQTQGDAYQSPTGLYLISGNIIRDFVTDTKTPLTTSSAIIGINSSSTTPGQSITQNTIYNLTTNDNTVSQRVRGIIYSGPTSGTNLINKNIVRNIKIASTTGGILRGIDISNSGSNPVTVQNNMIVLGNDASAASLTNSLEIAGIYEAGGDNNFYYNSVHILGTGVVNGTSGSFGFYSANAGNKTIKNNLFINSRSNSTGTGKHYGIRINSLNGISIGNNDYYASGTGAMMGNYNGTDVSTLAAWQSAIGTDTYSISAGVSFINPATDLHLTAAPSVANFAVNNEGAPIASVSTDFDGQTRNSYTPDPGFDEFIGTGSWVGKNSSVWEVSGNAGAGGNWEDGVVPTTALDAKVSNAPYQPLINSTTGTALVKDFSLKTLALVSVANGLLRISGTIINRSGNINATAGSLEMNGTSNQLLKGSVFISKTIKNLAINNSAGVTINAGIADTIKISSALTFGNVNSCVLTTNNNLVLLSSASGTAYLADLTNGLVNTGNSVSGNVTVERYISAGRRWRFLSFPTYGQSFKQSWQENAADATQNPKPGYGMYITDNLSTWSSNGFDGISVGGPTIKTYDPATDSWFGISNTSSIVSTTKGLMTFIRGNRANAISSTTNTSTILRSTGTLFQNQQPDITVPIGGIVSIGNPYAAAVDLRLLDKANTTDFFYVWDPKLSGVYSVGGYQLFSRSGANYVVTPGGGSYGLPGGITNYLESGQAFFIRGAGSVGRVTFKENAKAYGNSWLPYFTQGQSQNLRATLIIPGTDSVVVDGVFVNYDNIHSNNVDNDDALKFGNANENVGIRKENKILSVERRPEISGADTMFINTTGLRVQNYHWLFQLENMDAPGRFGFLVDQYLNSSTPLNLDGTTEINFSVVNIPASYAADRFRVLWTEYSALPVSFTVLAANRNTNGNIAVQWETENEVNILDYQLERSADGRNFNRIATTASKANNGSHALYSYIDINPLPVDNFYRVKAISGNGQVQFSSVVKVAALKTTASISVYPNPVADKKMNVQFIQQPSGNYALQLSNLQGQVIYQTAVKVSATVFAKTVELPASVATGQYQLLVTSASGEKTIQKIIIE